jgi:hypothetical protein
MIMDENNALVPNMAKLTITYNGQQGDLPDPVPYDSTDDILKQMAAESIRQGYIPGIDGLADVNFADFVVDRFPARPDVPFNRLSIRPKTPFGAEDKERENGVKAIIYLQKCAGIDEPKEKAEKAWAHFSSHQKEQTLMAFTAMGGECPCGN